MLDQTTPVTTSKEIRDYIIPLSAEEFSQLEKNILDHGCRDPLIVWQKGNQFVLVDGHNRLRICEKYNLPYKIKALSFKDLDEVKVWMVDNQMGRRNLTPDQMSYYRGLKYLSLKKKKGGYENVRSKTVSQAHTSEKLAERFNVSESTVKRDAKFAQGLNIIQRSNPKLKDKILSGETKVKKGDIQVLSSARNTEKLTIKNEADLHNKAKVIREEILGEVEEGIKKIHGDKILKAQESLRMTEPVFLNKEDKLKTIKGQIISAINRAINQRDTNAIRELRKLVGRLEDHLFD